MPGVAKCRICGRTSKEVLISDPMGDDTVCDDCARVNATLVQAYQAMPRFITQFEVGDIVRLRQDVERFPHFVARQGMLGQVKTNEHGLLEVEMFERLENCEEWGNSIQWDGASHEFEEVEGDLALVARRPV